MKLVWLSMLSPLILTACYNLQPWIPQESYVFNKSLRGAVKNIDQELEKSRETLYFEGGRKSSNCESYYVNARKYRLRKDGTSLENRGEYLMCDALKILPRNTSFQLPLRPLSISARNLARSLDMRSFPSSLRLASSEQKPTLNKLFPKDISYKGTKAVLDLGEWLFSVEVVAATDLNGNGKLDWIIWVADESKQGSYKGYQSLIVYDPEDKDLYSAIVFPNRKRQ